MFVMFRCYIKEKEKKKKMGKNKWGVRSTCMVGKNGEWKRKNKKI